jgi:predicted PurR-regulated permease PerM
VTGRSGPIVYATVVGTLVLGGATNLWSVARRMRAQGVEEAQRHRDIVLVVMHLVGVTVIGLITTLFWWHAVDQSQPKDNNVARLAEKMAADLESGPQSLDVPIDKEPDPGVFTESGLLSLQMDGADAIRSLSSSVSQTPRTAGSCRGTGGHARPGRRRDVAQSGGESA